MLSSYVSFPENGTHCLGYYRGYIDGQIGPDCRRSIVRCQSDYGLSPAGVVTVELPRLLGM